MVRKEMLDELQERFRDAVSGMPEHEHRRLLEVILKSARGSMEKGTISVCKRDRPAAQAILKGMAGYELGEDISCLGGAVVTAPDGEVSLDLRYETVLEDVWKEDLHHISSVLFGEAGNARS